MAGKTDESARRTALRERWRALTGRGWLLVRQQAVGRLCVRGERNSKGDLFILYARSDAAAASDLPAWERMVGLVEAAVAAYEGGEGGA